MRLVIQRCSAASVVVADAIVGEIGRGLVAFVGIESSDTSDDVNWCKNKLLNVKLFNAEDGRSWKRGVCDVRGDILLISNFTLHCKLKGNRPDFKRAAKSDQAIELFDLLTSAIREEHSGLVATGQFGAMMTCHVENDGPVTITVDSQEVAFPRKAHKTQVPAK